ncbi:hypothetical protein FHS07_002382 [Microbacterium proteolyticum]|uniref:Uncharacterized protein n=1 Tax=Microbacterium proteolyticum TaxID=1572644 RepID=A0A7W5CJ80_9MICO|nr:hypothetical protein [Microbacterium proteolyticum]MBB3158686.1 hypothetical protein [Microbacterium proteolyticum]
MSEQRFDVPSLLERSDELEHAAHRLRDRTAAVAPAADEIIAGWRDLGTTYDAPEAAELTERMCILATGERQTSEAFARVGAVLGELADALAHLERRRSALVEEEVPTSLGAEGSAFGQADVESATVRLQSDVASVIDDACRDLSGIAEPPPLPLAATGAVSPRIGPRITWQMRTEAVAVETMLTPLVETARGGAGRMRQILADHPDWVERLRRRPPAPGAVKAWWDALPPERRTALIDGAPEVMGALGGVPPLARVAANRIVAGDRLPTVEREIARLESVLDEGAMATLRAERRSALDRLLAERDYLGHVVAGEVQLVLYQPEENRIAEMIGTPGPGTRRVLTFVPGTFTSVDSFYGGGAQLMPAWLADQDAGMVAFVWKGADFPGDDEGPVLAEQLIGIVEANAQSRSVPAGQALARFSAEMRCDPQISRAGQIGAGYSWGLVAVTSSELAGTHFDAVHSLAGAWVPQGWTADATTTYFHWSYTDFLSMAQDVGWVGNGRNPDVTPGFETHIYDRPGDFTVPLGGELAPFLDPHGPSVRMSLSPLENHQLIVSDRPENFRPREDFRNSVMEVRD